MQASALGVAHHPDGQNLGEGDGGEFGPRAYGPGAGPGGFGPGGFGPGGFGPGASGPRGFGPGGRGRGRGFGPGFGPRGGRTRRGNVRVAVLALLAEQSQHGYQLITELSRRSGGRWNPSPGSVYPVLSQLADEGLVRPEEVDGRRVFHLTEAGAEAARETADRPRPWEAADGEGDGVDLRAAVGGLAGALREVARTGSPVDLARTRDIVDEARRAVYRLLAEGPREPAGTEGTTAS